VGVDPSLKCVQSWCEPGGFGSQAYVDPRLHFMRVNKDNITRWEVGGASAASGNGAKYSHTASKYLWSQGRQERDAFDSSPTRYVSEASLFNFEPHSMAVVFMTVQHLPSILKRESTRFRRRRPSYSNAPQRRDGRTGKLLLQLWHPEEK